MTMTVDVVADVVVQTATDSTLESSQNSALLLYWSSCHVMRLHVRMCYYSAGPHSSDESDDSAFPVVRALRQNVKDQRYTTMH